MMTIMMMIMKLSMVAIMTLLAMKTMTLYPFQMVKADLLTRRRIETTTGDLR